MPRLQTFLAVFVASLAILLDSAAQGQGLGGSRQSTGGGFGLTPNLGFGNSGFGGSSAMGRGSSLGGRGGLGQGGLGGGGLGQGGLGGGGLGGGLGGMSGFGGQTGGFGQGGSGFVGRDSAEVSAMFQNMSRQGQQFMNRNQRTTTRNRNRDRTGTTGETARQQVRVKLNVAFDYPDPETSPMTVAFREQVAKVLADRDVANLSLRRDGGEVIVSGIAASDWERKLVEQLLSQQPGVVSVTNQMTVAEPIGGPTLRE